MADPRPGSLSSIRTASRRLAAVISDSHRPGLGSMSHQRHLQDRRLPWDRSTLGAQAACVSEDIVLPVLVWAERSSQPSPFLQRNVEGGRTTATAAASPATARVSRVNPRDFHGLVKTVSCAVVAQCALVRDVSLLTDVCSQSRLAASAFSLSQPQLSPCVHPRAAPCFC